MNFEMFFVIYSETSANSPRGLAPRATIKTRKEIIDLAWSKVDRRGESLGDYSLSEAASTAGYSDDQLLWLSVEELGDDGRLFLIFYESEVEDFIEDGARFGVLEEARELAREALGEEHKFI